MQELYLNVLISSTLGIPLRVLTRTQNLIEIYEGVSPPPRKQLPPCIPLTRISQENHIIDS